MPFPAKLGICRHCLILPVALLEPGRSGRAAEGALWQIDSRPGRAAEIFVAEEMDLVGAIDTLERAIGIIEKVITAVPLWHR